VQTDYAALREGSLFELVNLVRWNNVRMDFKAASLQQVHGVSALLRLLCGRWVADIRANQAVRVLEGAKPVASFVRLGSAVHRLAAHAATLPVNSQVRWRACRRVRAAEASLALRQSTGAGACRWARRCGGRRQQLRGGCCIAAQGTCCTR
jgi:hypothetical protein